MSNFDNKNYSIEGKRASDLDDELFNEESLDDIENNSNENENENEEDNGSCKHAWWAW